MVWILGAFDPTPQEVREGKFFEDVEAFPCAQKDLLPYLQLLWGTIIRIAGHYHFTILCFDIAEGEGRAKPLRRSIRMVNVSRMPVFLEDGVRAIFFETFMSG